MSRHGLPNQLISDNGPPFNGFAFADFAHAYNFEHITSSPGYPQSNGKIENAVKTAKNLMTKAVESEQDPHLALLDWRDTPTEGLGSSPAQRLFGRRTRTLLPTSSTLLNPKIPTEVPQKLMKQKAKQAMYYNHGTKELNDLRIGDVVRIKPLRPGERKQGWTKARVESKADIRSYKVRTEDGREYRRNRRHLRQTQEDAKVDGQEQNLTAGPPPAARSETPDAALSPNVEPLQEPIAQQSPLQESPAAGPGENASTPPTRTSGRIVRPPVHLKDYITG